MSKLTQSIALSFAALSASVLLGAAAPPSGEATPIVNGSGQWVVPDGSTIAFQVHLVELPDGSLNGSGWSTRKSDVDGKGQFKFDVIESMTMGDDVAVLGVITETTNAPFPIGSLTALLIQDNGQGGGTIDRATSASGLPPFLTLADILPMSPPSGSWFPLASGNFVVH